MVLPIQEQIKSKRKNKEGRTRDIHSSAAKKTREKNLGGPCVLLGEKGLMTHPFNFTKFTYPPPPISLYSKKAQSIK